MNLPETWIEVPLGQLASIVGGGTPDTAKSEYFGGNIPWATPSDVTRLSGYILKSTAETITEEGLKRSASTLLPAGAVLLATRVAVGKVAITSQPTAINQDFAGLIIDDKVVSNEYLARFLESRSAFLEGRSQGSTIKGIARQAVSKLKVSLPTPPEQQHIIEVMQQLDSLELLRAKQLHDLSSLARERYYDLFGHPAENVRGFEVVSLTGLGKFDRGVSKHRPRDAAHLFNGPYPFIQTGDVTNAGDWITEYSATYSEAGLTQSRLWPKGTLCITIAANIARAAILDFNSCFPDSVVGFMPHPGVHAEYVLYCLRFYQEFFEQRAPQSAQMNINLEKLRALQVPKPPEPLQNEFAKFVRAVREVKDALREQQLQIRSVQQQLKLAAFSGELTAEWRSQHIAEVNKADAERGAVLRKGVDRISLGLTEHAQIERKPVEDRPARAWLVDQLSEFQYNVWLSIRERKGSVVPDETEGFADFCSNPGTAWPIGHEEASPDRIKRTLEQLAGLGLIAKVLIPNANGKYMTAFRPLREGEDARLADASRLETFLRQETEQ